jgi:hypothetical protein
MTEPDRLAGIVAFATVGAVTVLQDLAARVLHGVEGADPELVAEETLALGCTTTARAASFALSQTPGLAATAGAALLDLPLTYHDYLVGASILDGGSTGDVDGHAGIYRRLERKMSFYAVHLQDGAFPGPRALSAVMALWMGRVSPPRLPEMPQQRLERLELVDVLARHAALVRSHAGREA